VLVAATGDTGPDVDARAGAVGLDAVYRKPVDPVALVELLDALLGRAFPDASRPAPQGVGL
jgi:hypothetical protein